MGHIAFRRSVVPGRLELPTSTLSVWRSNQLSYRTLSMADGRPEKKRRAPHRSSHVISKRQRRESTETGHMPPIKGFRSLHLASLLVFYSLVESTGPHVCVVHNTTATRAASPERRCSSFLHLDLRFRFGRAAAATPAERIHRAMADARLLANPASWGRVADPSPN